MLCPLAGTQFKDGAVDVDDWQLPFRQEVPELLHGRLLDVCNEPKLPRKTLKFRDPGAVGLHVRLALEHALLDLRAEGSKDHPQARQSAGSLLLLAVVRKSGTHAMGEGLAASAVICCTRSRINSTSVKFREPLTVVEQVAQISLVPRRSTEMHGNDPAA